MGTRIGHLTCDDVINSFQRSNRNLTQQLKSSRAAACGKPPSASGRKRRANERHSPYIRKTVDYVENFERDARSRESAMRRALKRPCARISKRGKKSRSGQSDRIDVSKTDSVYLAGPRRILYINKFIEMLSDSRSGSDGHSGLDLRLGTPFRAAAFPKRRLVKGLPALTGSRRARVLPGSRNVYIPASREAVKNRDPDNWTVSASWRSILSI